MPQTVEAVYNCYARNQVIIMNVNNENESFLTKWCAKFHVPRPQVPVAPGTIPIITGQRAVPFGSIHYGYMQQEPRPWTPSQARFGEMPELAAQNQQARNLPFSSGQSNLRQDYGKGPFHPLGRNGPFRYPGGETDSSEAKTQVTNTPDSRKVSH